MQNYLLQFTHSHLYMLILFSLSQQLVYHTQSLTSQLNEVHTKEKKMLRFTDKNGEIVVIPQISYKQKHVVVITKAGKLYGYGNNTFGQLDLNMPELIVSPIEPTYLNNENITVKKVALGKLHTLILTTDGTVYSTGMYDYNQRKFSDFQVVQFNQLQNAQISNIYAVDSLNFAWNDIGEVYLWGSCNKKLCGQNYQYVQLEPTKLRGLSNIQSVFWKKGKLLFQFSNGSVLQRKLDLKENGSQATSPTLNINITKSRLSEQITDTLNGSTHTHLGKNKCLYSQNNIQELASGLSAGQVAGIIIGVLIIIGGFSISLWLLHKYRIIDLKAIFVAICCDPCRSRARRRAYTQVNKVGSKVGESDQLAYGDDDW